MGHLHHVHGEVELGQLLGRVLLVLHLETDGASLGWFCLRCIVCFRMSVVFFFFWQGTYVALQLAGMDRVSDADVVLKALQPDHLPFGPLEICSVLLLQSRLKNMQQESISST